jgi:PAS domain S-box-containing protein
MHLSTDTPANLRRLVLLLYAVVGPAFCASLAVLGHWRERPGSLAAVAVLVAVGALWLALRTSPSPADFVFPVAVAPVVCCAIGFVSCGDRGAAYLAVMGAPMAWAAVLFEAPVVAAALATGVVSVFVSLSLRIGPAAAAVSTALLSPVAVSVSWVVFGTARGLREARRRGLAHAERTRALLQAIPDTLARADREGRFVDVYCPPGDSLPVPKEQLIGRRFEDFAPPDLAARMREAIDDVLRTGEVRTVEYALPYGEAVRHFESRIARCGEDGVIVLRRDASEKRLADRVLRESEERYRSIIAATGEGLVVRRSDGAISVYNPAAERLLGIDAAQAEGRRPVDPGWCTIREDGSVLSAEERPNAIVLRTGKPVSDFTLGVHKPDGSLTWLSVNAQPVFREGEKAPHAVVAAYRDTTEQRRQAQDLAQSQRQLALAVEGSDLGYWEWDLRTDRLLYSSTWPALLGYGQQEIGSTLAEWARLIHPDDLRRVKADLVAHVKGLSKGIDAEFRMRTREGGWLWIHSRGRVVERDEGRRALRATGTHADVTRRHEAEERLREAQEKLHVATRLASVGTLAAGVAHEINNPLAWVTSNLGYALEAVSARKGPPVPGDPELREALEEAMQGADRIAAIVKAMRSLGRPGDAEEPRATDVRAELQNAIQMVRNQLVQRARLDVHVPERLPTARARTNELGRVFLNVLVNAAQSIPEGRAAENHILVSAREEGGDVVVEVADTGAGIPLHARHRIFEPFFTTKPVGVGTGLGLSIARSILEGAGGSIEFDTEEGKGTTFRVRVPAHGCEAAAPAAGAARAGASGSAPLRASRRVLVIDDEPLVRKSLVRTLSKVHDVTAVGSAAEALRRIDRGERWDAIFCDLMLPDVDGVSFYEALAARRSDAVAHLAFVTGGAFGERATTFLAEHRVVTLSKPVEPAELLAAAERLAQAPSAEREREARISARS